VLCTNGCWTFLVAGGEGSVVGDALAGGEEVVKARVLVLLLLLLLLLLL
jgi:hypothetical protein